MERKKRILVTKEISDIVISMAESEYKTGKIADTLNISRNCVRNILKNKANGVQLTTASELRRKTCKEKNITFNTAEQHLYTTVVGKNEYIQKEMSDEVFAQTGVRLSQPTVSRKLKKLGFSRKRLCNVPIGRNSPDVIKQRAIYAATLGRIAQDKIVFLDESGFNMHLERHYGYSVINQKAYKTVPSNRGVNNSLMCAININGVVAFEFRKGAYNKNLLVTFIEEKLAPYFAVNHDHYLIMDNVPFHHSKDVTTKLKELRINYDYLPPYSPQLNAIEEFFSMIKARYSGLKIQNPEMCIENVVNSLFSSNNDYSSQCNGFYSSVARWMEKARQKELFI